MVNEKIKKCEIEGCDRKFKGQYFETKCQPCVEAFNKGYKEAGGT